MRKKATGTMLTLLLMGTFVLTTSLVMLTLEVQTVRADLTGYITILPNGTVVGQPSVLILQNEDNYTYSQTGDIPLYGIVIERDNMTLDGNNSHIIGDDTYVRIGVNVTGRSHVMLKNLQIEKFQHGVELINSSYCQLYSSTVSKGNYTDEESAGIRVLNSAHITLFHDKVMKTGIIYPYHQGIVLNGSTYSSVFNCTVQNNGDNTLGNGFGIFLGNSSSHNNVFDNQVSYNHDGIGLFGNSDYNNIAYNKITYNGIYDHFGVGVELGTTAHNVITKNDVNSEYNSNSGSNSTCWDGGYPSYANGGNKWNGYNGADSNNDKIGDTPYVINENEQDNFPLMQYNYTYQTLTVESGGNGTTDPVPFIYPYAFPGMNVTVTATADLHYFFDHWLLDGTTNIPDNPTTIAIDSDHNLTAVFTRLPNETLTINPPDPTEAGYTTPAAGNYTYEQSTNASVTAHRSSSYIFTHWTLNDTFYSYLESINVTMDASYSLTPHFNHTSPPGCPYVYTWNGQTYVQDNNILPASETGNGTDTKDYYKLEQQLLPILTTPLTSTYSLQIREFENEQDYIDQVKLLALDHSQRTRIAVTPEGEIVTYTNPASPLSCVDNEGNSRLSEISRMDGNVSDPTTYFEGYSDNWLLLDFGKVTGPHAKLVLRDDWKCSDDCIDVQVPDMNGGWQTVEVLHPRDLWAVEAVNMTAYVPANSNFIVRLLWTAPHRLDYVGLDTSPPAQLQVSCASLTLAVHSTLGNVTATLLYDDENCVQLVNGQQITLAFILPNKAQGATRDFILYTNGYYYTITP